MCRYTRVRTAIQISSIARYGCLILDLVKQLTLQLHIDQWRGGVIAH